MSVTQADALVVREEELRGLVGVDRPSLDCIAECFGWLQDGRAMVPPVMHLSAADRQGDVDVKTAYVTGIDTFAVKIASSFAHNSKLGLPNGSGMMVVFSAATGYCEAVLLDNGYLTDLRTGLAGAVAADRLANPRIDSVGIIGCGVQAGYQLRCLALVRRFQRVFVWGRSRRKVDLFADNMRTTLGVPVDSVDSIERLMRQAQLVITVTASRSPLVRADWLHAGLHITAVGADFPGKQELEAKALGRADRIFCDRLDQCRRMGELQHFGTDHKHEPIELGAVVRGTSPGRKAESEITICDLTGVGVQDTAIANRVCVQLRRRKMG